MNDESNKKFGLENRTYEFAQKTRSYLSSIGNNPNNYEDKKQLLRSSGSVGANFIEACESLSRKDFAHRIKICRKEAKESLYWLKLIGESTRDKNQNLNRQLIQESIELGRIFGSILKKY